MPGKGQWEYEIKTNVEKVIKQVQELQGKVTTLENGEHNIKLGIDSKKLENVISNLDKMLASLGKGTGDFKEFENLSKQLNNIVSEVQSLNKAFGGINNSGASELLSSIKSIDKSLLSLSEHIVGINKDFGNIGKNANANVGQINETRKATEGLSDATKELANAQKNVENKSNISSGSSVKEVEKVSKAEQERQRQKDAFNKRNLNAIDLEIQKREEEYKMFSSALKVQMEEREKQISSMQSVINKFNKDYDNRDVKPTNENRSAEYQQALDKYRVSIDELIVEKKRLSNLSSISDEELTKFRELEKTVQKNAEAFKAFSASQKGSTETSRKKEIDKISKYLKENTKLSEEAKKNLNEYLNILRNGGGAVNVEKIHNAFLDVVAAERMAGREGKSFLDIFKTKVIHGFASQLAMYYLSFYDFIRYARNAINVVVELDTALIDLKKTTTMANTQLEDFYYSSNDVAKQMGVATQEIIDQASAWSRLGYNAQETATQMAQLSSQFASISPGMDTEQAQSGLVSIMKANFYAFMYRNVHIEYI